MILTGSAIQDAIQQGDIAISPFCVDALNPNSLNYRLGTTLKVFSYFDGMCSHFETVEIPAEGYVLQPHRMYLGHTLETIGSRKYAMSLIGRSSLGRLGLFLQISANLGHTTSDHQWTLELVAAKPIRLYAGMKIGQVSFWVNQGELAPSSFTYALHNQPLESQYFARN